MKALLQRVSEASVTVRGECVGAVGRGLLVLLGVERGDDVEIASRMAHKLVNYRVFADASGRMNRSLADIGGGLLLVPQFTLAADTGRGLRPGFSRAAEPRAAEAIFDFMCGQLPAHCGQFASGRFGADMRVALVNDGPVTFMLALS